MKVYPVVYVDLSQEDFKVICDETNNTPDIIDRNSFVVDIYIKPARLKNILELNDEQRTS